LPIYCDESGGVGRGVMTLAALSIETADADKMLAAFRQANGLIGELKGSRIDLTERALMFKLLDQYPWTATVGIAISALKPIQGEDRGDHDIAVYAELLDDVIASMLPATGGCVQIIVDDGRYGPATLILIRDNIAKLIGPCGQAQLELSHRASGLQIADVIANTFFNRALVTERQGRMAAIVAPFLKSGQMKLRLLAGNAERHDHHGE
jgi:Protein of unknown function (DUF3800)